MKLINLNAWGGTKYNELINLLTSNDWDFITLQEIFALQIDSNTPVLKNGKVMNLLDLLKKNLKQQHFFIFFYSGIFIQW